MTALWNRFKTWNRSRLIRKIVYRSIDLVLDKSEQRVFERTGKLLDDEMKAEIAHAYGAWMLAGGDQRLWSFIDKPERTIYLFLSELSL